MKLHELKTGMTVETRNRKSYRVIKDVNTEQYRHQEYLFCGKDSFLIGSDYNEDMMFCDDGWYTEEWDKEWDKELDIMKVYAKCRNDINILNLDVLGDLLWERKEVKELTVDEVSKLLGYKVKIVGEK